MLSIRALIVDADILKNDPVLVTILARLVEAFEPLRIYLFGSKARGDEGPDSDYDLVVIVPNDMPTEKRNSQRAYKALRGTGVAADVIVWTQEMFDSRLGVVASLPATVMREGKLIYVA